MKGFTSWFLAIVQACLGGSIESTWRAFALACAVIWFAAHANVIGPGALETWDESRFPHCVEAVRAFASGEIARGARYMVAGTQSRPTACVAWLPHIALYEGSRALGGSEAQSLKSALAGNFIWTTAITLCIFDLALLAFGLSPRMACLASLIFLGFFSTSINVKHFFPYDAALAISLGALVYALRCRRGPCGRAFVLGLCASAAFTTYPGYYFVYLVLGVSVFHHRIREASPPGISTFWFLAGAVLPLGVCEFIAQRGGVGFAASLRYVSGTVSLGSYHEMFTFPVSYAIHGEGELGCLTLLFALFAVFRVGGSWFTRHRQLDQRPSARRLWRCSATCPLAYLLIGIVIVSFLFHCLSGHYLHLFVWYRRLLHLFLPWVALSIPWCITALDRDKRYIAEVMIVMLILSSVGSHLSTLRHVGYPRDLLVRMGIHGVVVNPTLETTDLGCWPTTVEWRYDRWDLEVDSDLHSEVILRNFCSGFMPDGENPLGFSRDASSSKVIFSAPHYENIPAYQYDGIPPELRERIRRVRPRLEIRESASRDSYA